MTTPNQTPFYMSWIADEFGKYGDPYYLSSYYAGGGLVPAGSVSANGAIPASGSISLWHFMGATRAPTITFGRSAFTPRAYGYDAGTIAAPFGALNPTAAWPFPGGWVSQFCWQSSKVFLSVEGNFPNSGWSVVDMPGLGGYGRASAESYTSGGGRTTWRWATGANAFGNTGGTSPVIFT